MTRLWFIATHPTIKNAMDREWYASYKDAEEDWDILRTFKGFEKLRIFSATVVVDEQTIKE